jgi:hypothetical protein
VAEDLMEDGTISQLTQARKKTINSIVEELTFVIVIVGNVKKKIKPPQMSWKTLKKYVGRFYVV